MCSHEGKPCHRRCRCDCQACPGHGGLDDYYEEQDDPIYLSALYSDEMENPL